MAFSGSSIAIVFIGVTAYAAAGPVQLHGGSTTLQRDEYGPPLADLVARYWNDRGTNQGVKQNLDPIDGEHLVRVGNMQFEKDRFAQNINFDDDENTIDAHGRTGTFGNRLYSVDSNTDEFFAHHLGDVLKNALESDGRVARNLDQIGGGNLVRRNLDQIGGGNLVRRNLDQIGGGNLVRSLDYSNAEQNRHADQPNDAFENLLFARNLDQIGGGNLVRNLDPIGDGNLVRSMN